MDDVDEKILGSDAVSDVYKNDTKTHYVFLDSNNRLNPNTEMDINGSIRETQLEWILNYSKPEWKSGYINLKEPIKNIISVEIDSVVFTDRKSTARNYTMPNSLLPETGYYEDSYTLNQRIALTIDELSTQSHISPTGTRYHFLAKRKAMIQDKHITRYPNKLIGFPTFIPIYNHGKYEFASPIDYIDKITLKLYGPDIPIYMDREIINVADIEYTTNYKTLTLPAPFTFSDPFLESLVAGLDQNFLYVYFYDTIPVPYTMQGMVSIIPGSKYYSWEIGSLLTPYLYKRVTDRIYMYKYNTDDSFVGNPKTYRGIVRVSDDISGLYNPGDEVYETFDTVNFSGTDHKVKYYPNTAELLDDLDIDIDAVDTINFITLILNEDEYIEYNDITIEGFTTANPVVDADVINRVNSKFVSYQLHPNEINTYKRVKNKIILNVSSVGITPLIPAPKVVITCKYNFTACLRFNCK